MQQPETGTLTAAATDHPPLSADQRRTLVLETAHRVAVDILAQRTGVEALRHIADAARTLAGARYAALGVARADGKGLTQFITVGLSIDEETRIGARPRGAGVLGLLLEKSEPLRIDRIAGHERSSGFPPNHPPMDSFLGVPIRRGTTNLGSLYLTEKLDGSAAFTEDDEAAVVALGAHAAVAIQHLQMLEYQGSLVRGLIRAQEEERSAVAYDLHDGLTQYVMAAHAHLEAFKRASGAPNGASRAERELDQGLKYLKEAVTESRRLINGLRPLALDDLGLAEALEQLLREEKARAGWIEAALEHNIAGRRFDRTVETGAYRVVQEALTNARKHAYTERVRVTVLWKNASADATADAAGSISPPAPRDERLTVEIRDWGTGFLREEHETEQGHIGLQSMAQRARLLDGTYDLTTTPGEGTTVCVVIPVLPNSDPKDETVL